MNAAQQKAVEHYKAYNVPASWFVAEEPDADGGIEVVALGEGFAWSILIDADGTPHASEATLGEFSTGIDV